MSGRVTRIGVVLAMVVWAFACTAVAHTPRPSLDVDVDLRYPSAAPERVSFTVFARPNAFSEFTHIALPQRSISDELTLRFASTNGESPRDLRTFDPTINRKLASGPRSFTLQSKSSEWRELGEKPRWGEENKAAPFIDPATEWAHLRARWYDPTTGAWLTPDPMSYADGSNLYAAFRSDPINLSDPKGEVVPLLAAGAAYLGWTLLNSAIDVGVDYLLAEEGEFDINASIGTNVTINALTGGLAKLKQLRHLKRATRFAIEFGADVSITGAVDALAYGQSWEYAYGSAAVGGAVGHGTSYGLRRAGSWLRDATWFDVNLNFTAADAQHIGANVDLLFPSRRRLGVLRTSGDAVNATFPASYQPPYLARKQVIEYTSALDERFVCVHGADSKARAWLMRPEAIHGLTAVDIQRKYSLPTLPEFVSDVFVPAGTRMRRGHANALFGGNRGAVQYELLDRLAETAFRNTRRLQ